NDNGPIPHNTISHYKHLIPLLGYTYPVIFRTNMQMWLSRIPSISYLTNFLTFFSSVSFFYLHTILSHMCYITASIRIFTSLSNMIPRCILCVCFWWDQIR